jgi:hypothetical protein
VLRSGNRTGSSPTSFDTVATVYDSMGRVLKQSNPYSGDLSGNKGTGVTLYWTPNTYDPLSRVTEVDLPDDQPTRTGIGGPKQAYASGLNWVFRKVFSGPGLGAAIKVGDKVTPALAVTGTLTGSYNATIAAQCLAGILE